MLYGPQIRQKIDKNKVVEETKEILGLSEDDAITALKHYNWNLEKLQEQWFDNEAKTRQF